MNEQATQALADAEAEAAGVAVAAAPTVERSSDFVGRLRQQTCGVRVRHAKFGVRKALTREQVSEAAETFGAESKLLTAAKRLIDTRDPTYRAVGKVRAQARSLFVAMSVPFPEPGTRLIRRENIPLFDEQMKAVKARLVEAVESLQANYGELRAAAKEKLGDLFNEADYPERIDEEFDLVWDFPNLDPPGYLKTLNPQLYEQEVERVQARFAEAVRMTEQAFVAKLAELVSHLGERLTGEVDGKPKTFRDSSIANLKSFFDEFKALDIGDGGKLNAIVEEAKNVVDGIVSPDELRGNLDLRSRVADQLAAVQSQIESLMVNTPDRAIDLDDEGNEA